MHQHSKSRSPVCRQRTSLRLTTNVGARALNMAVGVWQTVSKKSQKASRWWEKWCECGQLWRVSFGQSAGWKGRLGNCKWGSCLLFNLCCVQGNRACLFKKRALHQIMTWLYHQWLLLSAKAKGTHDLLFTCIAMAYPRQRSWITAVPQILWVNENSNKKYASFHSFRSFSSPMVGGRGNRGRIM